jgi:hypothetical protein
MLGLDIPLKNHYNPGRYDIEGQCTKTFGVFTMEIAKPKKGYLYTWNFVDGFVGLPKRKINLSKIKPALLHVAYLGGGHRWDSKGTPSGAILCLILSASPRRNQSARNCYKFYENYNIKDLRETFNGKTEELSGGGCAWWSVEFDCLGWTNDQIDANIEEVLQWHNQEIERIKKIEDVEV